MDDAGGGGCETVRDTASAVPLPRLHALLQSLCALHESSKGVDQAVALGEQFLQTAVVRRALAALGESA